MVHVDEKLEPILNEVLRRNAGEFEFHQAVREVLGKRQGDPIWRR